MKLSCRPRCGNPTAWLAAVETHALPRRNAAPPLWSTAPCESRRSYGCPAKCAPTNYAATSTPFCLESRWFGKIDYVSIADSGGYGGVGSGDQRRHALHRRPYRKRPPHRQHRLRRHSLSLIRAPSDCVMHRHPIQFGCGIQTFGAAAILGTRGRTPSKSRPRT